MRYWCSWFDVVFLGLWLHSFLEVGVEQLKIGCDKISTSIDLACHCAHHGEQLNTERNKINRSTAGPVSRPMADGRSWGSSKVESRMIDIHG